MTTLSDPIRKPVSELSGDAISVEPVSFDWSGDTYGDGWDIVYPSADRLTMAECHAILDDAGRDFPDPDPWSIGRDDVVGLLTGIAIECSDDEPIETLRDALMSSMDDEDIDGIEDWREAVRESWQESEDFTPMMSYYYPLPGYHGDASADQAVLAQHGGNVALATVNDETVLTLTGGGMDFSWEICEGFMLLGYLPPLHFCGLPRMAGTKLDSRTAWILSGCIDSARVAEQRAHYTREDLERYRDELASGTA